MKPTVTWVLLADGAQAKVFSHSGPGTGLTPVPDLLFEEEPLKAHELGTDRPGRSFSSVGHGRSAIEPSSDPVALREASFVRNVAEQLDRKFQESAFSRLIIVATPSALGTLRGALTDGVRAAVVAEQAKNLTNLPTAQLERHFDDLLTM